MTSFESIVEQAAIEWLERLGYAYVPGWELASDGSSPERTSHGAVILEGRSTLAALRDALLPKLISGELRVPEAEKLVEATCRPS